MEMTMLFRSYLFILPVVIGIVISLIALIDAAPKKKPALDKYDILDKPFDNLYSNKLYEWSFKSPFISFVPEDPNSEKAKDDNELIAMANMSSKLDYRTLTTMQIFLFFLALVVTGILAVIVIAGGPIFGILFNLEGAQSEINQQLIIGILIVMLLLALTPKMVMSNRAKKNKLGFVKDLPTLQMFIVLMLRSRRTISEVMYTLSVSEMRYKEIFATAYRIYIRNQDQAFDYLLNVFGHTGFKDSVIILQTFDDYSREDSANVLQSGISDLLEEVEAIKKDKSVAAGLFSEGSVAFPFISVFCLGVFPIVTYAMELMDTAQQF